MDPVRRVYIHLDSGRDPDTLADFGPFVVATRNSLQAVLSLAEEGMVQQSAVVTVGRELFDQTDLADLDVAAAVLDAARRRLVSGAWARRAAQMLADAGMWPTEVAMTPRAGPDAPAVAELAGGQRRAPADLVARRRRH